MKNGLREIFGNLLIINRKLRHYATMLCVHLVWKMILVFGTIMLRMRRTLDTILDSTKKMIADAFENCPDARIEFVRGRIIYKHEEQIELFYCELKELLNAYDNYQSGIWEYHGDIQESFSYALYDFVQKNKMFIKNPAFESENEYRFILKIHKDLNDLGWLKADYRIGEKGAIIPYYEWDFSELKSSPIKQITLSPMIEPELAVQSLSRFFANDVDHGVAIKPSSIQLRY